MRSLNGKLFSEQIEHAMVLLDKLPLSKRTLQHRKYMLLDFERFLKRKGLVGGKINKFMDAVTMDSFFLVRLVGLSSRTKENYIRSFGMLIQNLQENEVLIDASKNDFDEIVKVLHEGGGQFKSRKTIDMVKESELLNGLVYPYNIIYTLQLEHGFRVNEAVRIVNGKEEFLSYENNDTYISNVIGPRGTMYIKKKINSKLKDGILGVEFKVSVRTYQDILKKFGVRSKELRFTYERTLMLQGMERAAIALELNLKR